MLRSPPRSTVLPYTTLFRSRRRLLGGYMPTRQVPKSAIVTPPLESLKESLDGSGGREVSSTMAFVRVLTIRSEEHTSELQSPDHLVFRLLLSKKRKMHVAIS